MHGVTTSKSTDNMYVLLDKYKILSEELLQLLSNIVTLI